MEEFLREKFGASFDVTPTCSTMPPHQPGDDFTDDGSGSGTGGVPDSVMIA
jgi:hypothetical protein